MDFITMLNASSSMPKGFWENIIGWFQSFIGNYGWTIILFTICLKLVLIPLDFWQKRTTRINSQKQALLQPEIAKIKQKYGNNEQMVNQKTMELYKANNYNVVGTCFGLLINLVVTTVIFFTLFASLNNVSYFKIKQEYEVLESTYLTSYKEETLNLSVYKNEGLALNGEQWDIDFNKLSEEEKSSYENVDNYKDVRSEEYALNKVIENSQKDVSLKYGEIKESWLWIKNIWRPDTNASIFPKTAKKFISLSNKKFEKQTGLSDVNIDGVECTEVQVDTDNDGVNDTTKYSFDYYYESLLQDKFAYTKEQAVSLFTEDYNLITAQLVKDYNGFNGYFILIILAGVLTFLSQFLMNLGVKAKNKKGEEVKVQNNNKVMMVVLTAIMIYFTWSYSAAFSLYIIVNSLMSTLLGILINLILNKIDKIKENKKQAPVVEYSRKK